MNLGKLAKRLKKELAANPKQAAVLGIGCVIAVWFWAPLVMRWWKPKSASVVAVAATPSTTTETPATATTELSSVRWRDVRDWRQADPLMRSTRVVNERDPFAVRKKEDNNAVAQADTTELSAEPTDPEETLPLVDETRSPEQLGLTLESIAYSNTRRRAQISGRTFKEQDDIPLGTGDQDKTPRPPCRVKSIEPTYVLVDFQGREIRLELPRKTLAQGDLVERR